MTTTEKGNALAERERSRPLSHQGVPRRDPDFSTDSRGRGPGARELHLRSVGRTLRRSR